MIRHVAILVRPQSLFTNLMQCRELAYVHFLESEAIEKHVWLDASNPSRQSRTPKERAVGKECLGGKTME
jgi:hypothetical protein